MANSVCWIVYDTKRFLIEYIRKTTSGVALSINGSEAFYMSVATEAGESAWITCGNLVCRLDLTNQGDVTLWINDVKRTPLPVDMVANLKPQIKKPNINIGLIISVIVVSMINAGNVFVNETNYTLRCGVIISLILLAVYVLLYFFAAFLDAMIWFSFIIIVVDILLLFICFFYGLDVLNASNPMWMDIQAWLNHLAVRVFYLIDISVYCYIAAKLFNLARNRKLIV